MILAIDIEAFTDLETYTKEVEAHAAYVGSAKPLPGVDRVYAPGEIEEVNRKKRLEEGIYIPEPTWEDIRNAADDLGVSMPEL